MVSSLASTDKLVSHDSHVLPCYTNFPLNQYNYYALVLYVFLCALWSFTDKVPSKFIRYLSFILFVHFLSILLLSYYFFFAGTFVFPVQQAA